MRFGSCYDYYYNTSIYLCQQILVTRSGLVPVLILFLAICFGFLYNIFMSTKKIIEKNRIIEENLISCILPLVESGEYIELSIREICERIGITTGMFYRHFRSKNELLSICVNQRAEVFMSSAASGIKDKPLKEQLKLLTLADFQAGQILGPDVILMYISPGDSSVQCKVSREIFTEKILDCIHNTNPGLEGKAMQIADALVILLKGISFEWYTQTHEGNDQFDPHACIEAMLDYTLSGLLDGKENSSD
jgi:Transcriptional regulator